MRKSFKKLIRLPCSMGNQTTKYKGTTDMGGILECIEKLKIIPEITDARKIADENSLRQNTTNTATIAYALIASIPSGDLREILEAHGIKTDKPLELIDRLAHALQVRDEPRDVTIDTHLDALKRTLSGSPDIDGTYEMTMGIYMTAIRQNPESLAHEILYAGSK